MCELVAVPSRSPTKVTFSLKALAGRSGPSSSLRDGWGVGFYQGNDVALFREPSAASDSPLVRFLEEHGPPTGLAISHIRHATRGDAGLSNTHPFVREIAGRAHLFAHNGDLPDITRHPGLRLGSFRPIGETDSEYAFCALLERIRSVWEHDYKVPSIYERLAVISEFPAMLRKLGPANFLYADSDLLFAHGDRRRQLPSGRTAPPGLFLLPCQCDQHDKALEAKGATVAQGYREMSMVASVPLTEDHWQPFAEGEIVAVAFGKIIARTVPSAAPGGNRKAGPEFAGGGGSSQSDRFRPV